MASEAEGVEELVKKQVVQQEVEETKEKVLYDTSKQQKTADIFEGAQSLITVIVLGLCCVASFSSRLFAVIRFESIIHEFDPWYVQNITTLNLFNYKV